MPDSDFKPTSSAVICASDVLLHRMVIADDGKFRQLQVLNDTNAFRKSRKQRARILTRISMLKTNKERHGSEIA